MEEFAAEFKKRLDAATPHGKREKLAREAGVSYRQLLRWGNLREGKQKKPGQYQIPNIMEVERAAGVLAVSPAWLAWGHEPSGGESYVQGLALAESFMKAQGLGELTALFVGLNPEARVTLLKVAYGLASAQTSAGVKTIDTLQRGAKLAGEPLELTPRLPEPTAEERFLELSLELLSFLGTVEAAGSLHDFLQSMRSRLPVVTRNELLSLAGALQGLDAPGGDVKPDAESDEL